MGTAWPRSPKVKALPDNLCGGMVTTRSSTSTAAAGDNNSSSSTMSDQAPAISFNTGRARQVARCPGILLITIACLYRAP